MVTTVRFSMLLSFVVVGFCRWYRGKTIAIDDHKASGASFICKVSRSLSYCSQRRQPDTRLCVAWRDAGWLPYRNCDVQMWYYFQSPHPYDVTAWPASGDIASMLISLPHVILALCSQHWHSLCYITCYLRQQKLIINKYKKDGYRQRNVRQFLQSA